MRRLSEIFLVIKYITLIMLLVVGILVGLRNCINFSWANESQEIALTKVYAENKAENA